MRSERFGSGSRAPRTFVRSRRIDRAHDILRTVGVNPRTLPPSTESLLRYALRRGALPVINNLVDAYNLVSVRTKSSLGAHDLDRIETPVQLRLLQSGERFTPLGGAEGQDVTAGEFGYVTVSTALSAGSTSSRPILARSRPPPRTRC